MGNTSNQNDFLVKRSKLVKSWQVVGPTALLMIFILVLYLYLKTPMMINPFEVLAKIQKGLIEQSTLEFMAVILPLMVITTCFLLVILVIVMNSAIDNEKKYIEMIDDLQKKQ
jgi:hypothetical protein